MFFLRKQSLMMAAVVGVLTAVIAVANLGLTPSLAHDKATGVVKLRMESMKGMADAMKTIATMLKGKIDYDARALASLGAVIKTHAGENLTKNFPEGSLTPPSEASPAIWKDWASFKAAAAKLETAAVHFNTTVEQLRAAAKEALAKDPVVRGSFADTDVHLLPPTGDQVEQLRAAFLGIGKSCKSCHESFRIKKEK